MIRLATRLATAGGRSAVLGLGLTALAVAIGAAVLLFALSFVPAIADRDARSAWRETFVLSNDPDTGTLVSVVGDHVDGQRLLRVLVAPAGPGTVAVPPGLDRLPAPGTAYVSPALATLIESRPAGELGDRFGRIAGTLPNHLLASPDELVAVVGMDRGALTAEKVLTVSRFATEPAPLDLPPVGALVVILAAVGALAPVAVFVATATRMSAARREQRLAALRLVGATPAQVARLAVVEALIATGAGGVGGVALFVATRPLIARIPLDEMTWWPESIAPPLPAAVLLFAAIQVVGAAAALVAMRRLTISPLGVQRRSAVPPPTARRLAPLGLAVVALLAAVAWYRTDPGRSLPLAAAGLAFAGVVGGIALAGPWLTAIVGRSLHRLPGTAATLLAGRRLADDPRGSFGAIAGVIMAVFVASAFFTFAGYIETQAAVRTDPLLRGHGAVALLTPSARTPELGHELASIDGVARVLEVRDVYLVVDDGIRADGWIVRCADVVTTLGLSGGECDPSGVTTVGGAIEPGAYTVVAGQADPTTAGVPSVPLRVGTNQPRPPFPALGDRATGLPALLIDPAAIGGLDAVQAFPVTRIFVTTDDAGVAERIRTAVVRADPTAQVRVAGEPIAGSETFAEIGRVVALGLVGSLGLAGCSLAVAVTTATLERRSQFVFLRSAGMPVSGLHATVLLQAGVPLVVVAAFSTALGIGVALVVLQIAGVSDPPVPDPSLFATLVASLAVAMGIVGLTLPPLERMTRPASLRYE